MERKSASRKNRSASRYKKTRKALVFWAFFIGTGAVFGSACMFIDKTGKRFGMDAFLIYFQVLPFADVLFKDLLFSGTMLLVVNGLTNLTAAVLLIARKKSGVVCSVVFGITLMLWICIQFYLWGGVLISVLYFIFGFTQSATAVAALIFRRQENFRFKPSDYKNIGTDKTRLVVFFSRMGYTKKIAYEEADRTGADIYEIVAAERTEGTLGFWWCGRFGIHRWEMPVEFTWPDVSSYEIVTIVTPVWVFGLSAPVRTFCRMEKDKVKEANYIIVHFTGGKYGNVEREMNSLLGRKASSVRNIRNRFGKAKEIV